MENQFYVKLKKNKYHKVKMIHKMKINIHINIITYSNEIKDIYDSMIVFLFQLILYCYMFFIYWINR